MSKPTKKPVAEAAEVSAPEVQPVAPKESKADKGIATAIVEGLATSSAKKGMKISVDKSVVPRFSIVKNKEGEVMLRENETNVLSRIQLQSLEEKQASIQNQEVEEV